MCHDFFLLQQHLPFTVLKLAIRYVALTKSHRVWLQQHLPFTVCAAECEAVEEQSDDEAHTLQVPERSEGKKKGLKGYTYCLQYWNAFCRSCSMSILLAATAHIVYGIETLSCSGFHEPSWIVATVSTIYGIETHKQNLKGFVS